MIIHFVSSFVGFGPELWLRPAGDPAEAADGVQRVWSAGWSRPQHRSEPQHSCAIYF